MKFLTHTLVLSWLVGLLLSPLTMAAQKEAPLPDTFATHKVVLQISDPNPFKQTLVLNVAGNLMKYYGAGDVDIEIVAFGPGLRLMMAGNVNTPRIKSMMSSGIRFSACQNTLNNYSKKLGYTPKIIPGVQMVPAGAGRILQLNAAGYQILKP
ncbi:DsrE family protein [Hydrogenovibrio kuenenii]|uniref:DsrE family protein n=1 Tax=Hydrogenovibrio kuenenii TaxID=63658 RepID=UPI000463FE45|nr:DsrE family protein [Hydrogenovibrio kuenenii]